MATSKWWTPGTTPLGGTSTYLLDGGLGENDHDIAIFDSAFDEYFPNHKRTGKFYHPKVDPDPAAVRGFSAWLSKRIAEIEAEHQGDP